MNSLHPQAVKNVTDILNICIRHDATTESALVVYDSNSELAEILLLAYREALPHAHFVDFDQSNKEEILREFDQMRERDLVVMIQSTNFLLNEFRIRLHLFNHKLKVIEHMHLARNTEDMWTTYIDALAYDIDWYPQIAPRLKSKLDSCEELIIYSRDKKLISTGGLEPAMLNIGD